MKHLWKAIPAIGLLFGMTGIAYADDICTTPGNFLSILDQANEGLSGFTGPYGEVCVQLVDDNTANIEALTFSPYGFVDTNALALNFSGDVTLVGSITSDTAGPFAQDTTGGSNVNGFGSFNFRVSEQSASQAATTLTFQVDLNSGTWASVSDVLAFNAPSGGFDAAAHVNVAGSNCDGSPCTGFAGENSEGIIIRETPEPGVLSLLGIALVGMGYTARRRKA